MSKQGKDPSLVGPHFAKAVMGSGKTLLSLLLFILVTPVAGKKVEEASKLTEVLGSYTCTTEMLCTKLVPSIPKGLT